MGFCQICQASDVKTWTCTWTSENNIPDIYPKITPLKETVHVCTECIDFWNKNVSTADSEDRMLEYIKNKRNINRLG